MPDDTRPAPRGGSASRSSSRRSAASPPTPSTCATAPTSRRWRRSRPSCCPPTTSSPCCATRPAPGGCRARKGAEGTCGGQALAALIDAQRIHAQVAEPYQASARMIYECARLATGARGAPVAGVAAERRADDAEGVSLRDVIKAFYNYGVCRETLWPYAAGGDPGQLSVERARDAKSLSLGAYYRLRPNLNTYHAALHETGAVVVSAELHDGWLPKRVRAKGEIVPPRPGQPPGTLDQEKHAFVVVGYTPEGSSSQLLGPRLGRLGAERRGADPRRRALALRGLGRHRDGRLGPPARRRRRRGLPVLDRRPGPRLPQRGSGPGDPGARHPRQLPPPRRRRLRRLRGLRLDPPDPRGDPAPARVRRRQREALPGGAADLRRRPRRAARRHRSRRPLQAPGPRRGLVPVQRPLVRRLCRAVARDPRRRVRRGSKRAGPPSARLDRVVEEMAYGVGRAIWRDIARAADVRPPRRPAARPRPRRRGAPRRRPGFGLRLVAESEGAIAVASLLRAMRSAPFAGEAPPSSPCSSWST